MFLPKINIPNIRMAKNGPLTHAASLNTLPCLRNHCFIIVNSDSKMITSHATEFDKGFRRATTKINKNGIFYLFYFLENYPICIKRKSTRCKLQIIAVPMYVLPIFLFPKKKIAKIIEYFSVCQYRPKKLLRVTTLKRKSIAILFDNRKSRFARAPNKFELSGSHSQNAKSLIQKLFS